MAHPEEPRVLSSGKEGRQTLLKALRNPGCQEVTNTCLGFLNNLTGFFLSWSRAGWAPGDISPRSVASFLPRASQGEGEQDRGVGAELVTGRGSLSSLSSQHSLLVHLFL